MGNEHSSNMSGLQGSNSNAFEASPAPSSLPSPQTGSTQETKRSYMLEFYPMHARSDNNDESVVGCDVSMEDAECSSDGNSRRVVVNPMTSHVYKYIFTEAQPAIRGCQHRADDFMTHCQLCKKPLNKEENDIFIFKGEYAYCSKKCRKVAIDREEGRERKALKEADAKRAESIGTSPAVVFEIGSSADCLLESDVNRAI